MKVANSKNTLTNIKLCTETGFDKYTISQEILIKK